MFKINKSDRCHSGVTFFWCFYCWLWKGRCLLGHGYSLGKVNWTLSLSKWDKATSKLFRTSHRRWSIKKGVLKNSQKFTGKHLCQSLFFNKAAGHRLATLLKTKLWHRCFPVNFAKFLRTAFYRTPLRDSFWIILLFFLQDWGYD